MIYYPVNYPVLRIQPNKTVEPLVARVIYSRPQKQGRKVFGELVEDGKIWRLGANEATEIEFFKEVKIGATKIKKGCYTLYAFKYDEKKDLLRYECKVKRSADILETFSMAFEKLAEKSFQLLIGWEDAQVALPISIL